MSETKKPILTSHTIKALSLLLSFLALGGSMQSCILQGDDPHRLPDYDNNDGFILDYAVGDRFRTRKPMFLTRPTGEGLALAKEGVGAPSVEQYSSEPERFAHVMRLVPSGTLLRLVAVKDAGYSTSVTYVMLDGYTEWIGVGLGEYVKVGVNTHRQYCREYFQKIDEP